MAKKKAAKGAKGRAAKPSPRQVARDARRQTRAMATSGQLQGAKVKGGRGVKAHTTTRGDTGRRITVYTKGGKVMRKSRKGGFVEGAGGDE